MGDGASAENLVRKRNEVEIARLQHQKQAHELELLELEDRKGQIAENIKACDKAIEHAQTNIDALDK